MTGGAAPRPTRPSRVPPELLEWLRVQVQADEEVARAASPAPWRTGAPRRPATVLGRASEPDHGPAHVCSVALGRRPEGDADHITNWDPCRALRECAAKNELLDLLQRQGPPLPLALQHALLRVLSLPYRDRRGFQPQWRPEP